MDYVLNTLRPRQDGRHFPDDIFKSIFLNENVGLSIKISLKFVSRCPINNIPALVQKALCRPGDKPLSEPMMVSLLTHICVTRPQWVDEHLDFKPTWSICNTISDNIVIQLIWKFQESNWNPDWLIASIDSFGTNYIFTNNKYLGQYDQNAIPSQIMPCYSYPGNLINQNEIPIELTC